MNKIFNQVPVQITNKSGFDLSHQNLYTLKCGTLVPILVDQLIPGDTISLGHLTEVQLPPMATDFYGRVQFRIECFFVPNRLCYGGFQQFMTQATKDDTNIGYPLSEVKYLPYFQLPLSAAQPGSLADYLGFKRSGASFTNGYQIKNPLPFIAYHKIWSDWYRDSVIQKDCFSMPYSYDGSGGLSNGVGYLPHTTFRGSTPQEMDTVFADGLHIYDLRQRCFGKDYFTNAKPRPQLGKPSTLAFNVEGDTGSFTIASLRAANSLQQWLERNSLAGSRYVEQIRAHYGVTPSDAIMDRTVWLGSHSFDVYNKGVYQSTNSEVSTNNPMNTVATKFSSPLGVSDSSLVDNFSVTEFGFLFVIGSIVPDALYSTGQRRYLDYQVVSDFANSILSSVGDQEIKNKEIAMLRGDFDDADGTFGYTQRYSEYKFMLDEVHGELQDVGSLSSFALQRSFVQAPELGSSFLEIPSNYMDQVTAVSGDMSKYGAWCNSYFKYKKSSVLPAYSIPTLGDPKDTHTEVISNGGIRL